MVTELTALVQGLVHYLDEHPAIALWAQAIGTMIAVCWALLFGRNQLARKTRSDLIALSSRCYELSAEIRSALAAARKQGYAHAELAVAAATLAGRAQGLLCQLRSVDTTYFTNSQIQSLVGFRAELDSRIDQINALIRGERPIEDALYDLSTQEEFRTSQPMNEDEFINSMNVQMSSLSTLLQSYRGRVKPEPTG